MESFKRISRYVEQAVSADSLPTQLHAAARDLFGAGLLALLETDGPDHYRVLALVDREGKSTGRFNPAIDARREPVGAIRKPDTSSGQSFAMEAMYLDEQAALVPLFEPGQHGLILPWVLGGYDSGELLLVGDKARLHDLDELSLLQFCQIATSLFRKAERAELKQAQFWIDEELDRIAALQQSLRPETLENIAGAHFAWRSSAYRLVGGDYFDVARFEQRRVPEAGPDIGDVFGLTLADVSGHGPAAAVEAAMLDAIIRTYRSSRAVEAHDGPHSILNYLNEHVFTRRPRASFMTAVVAGWQPYDRSFRYACAGHPPPLLRPSADKACYEMAVPGDIPLGVLREYSFSERSVRLEPGDMVAFYTDGIIEARSPQGEPFGLSRVREAIAQAKPDPHDALSAVCQALDTHCGGAEAGDDRTMIIVQLH